MIKVALIDNMNNNFFAFARYLRDEGIDAHLYEIPNSSMEHFKPQADTFVDVTKMDWIHEFPIDIKNKSWFLFDKTCLNKEFMQYDIIISCGLSSAYLKKCNINSDIVIPYGSDLYDMPFRNINFTFDMNFIRSFFWKNQAKYQKKAYKNARCVITNLSHYLYHKSISKLDINAISHGLPMLYNKENTKNIHSKFDFLNEHDFIVFNHSRQLWYSNPTNLEDFNKFKGNKRNDKTIMAFADFLKITKYKKPILILFNYGIDVKYSKKLIRDLNISSYVKWMDVSFRKDIMLGLSRGSVGIDQVRENICGIGGTSYEVLASGIPLLTHTAGAVNNQDDLFFNSPIVEVLTIKDILNVFLDYEQNPKKYKEIGQKSKEWFDENLGLGLAQKYAELIKLLVKDRTLTQNEKIVREIFEN